MHNLSLKEMIDAGVHFGHQTKYWNPKMKPFIFTTYKKLHIINLEKSVEQFNKALEYIDKISKNNSKILFVGTKRAARELIKKHAIDCDMPYVNNRWLGGTLTNFNTVKKSIEKLENLNSDISSNISGDLMTKKEALVVKKQISKLDKNLSGVKKLTKVPDALFIIDTGYERIAIQEANKLNIPVIASGGVGELKHFRDGVSVGGASALLAASVFHFNIYSISEVKSYLKNQNIEVRL